MQYIISVLRVMGMISISPYVLAHQSYKAPIIECIFSHGIADTGAQVHNYTRYLPNSHDINRYYTIEAPVYTFDYPDATRHFWRVNFWHTSLGQKNEMQKLETIINNRRVLYVGMKTQVNYILYGVSRGASVIINAIGNAGMRNKTVYSDIRALVLESPFDHIHSVAHAVTQRLRLSRFSVMPSLVHSVISVLFRRYKKNGISPLFSADTIPYDIPILIICSKEDTLIPWQSSFELYKRLRQTNHRKTHILVLPTGNHARLFSQLYHEVVHAFYKHYGLPHNTYSALKGERNFLLCTPDIK